MIEASLMAYAVSGAFLSQSYWDLFYHLVSFVVLLQVIAVKEGVLAVPVRAPVGATGMLGVAVPGVRGATAKVQ
jgi:hypothetical protein